MEQINSVCTYCGCEKPDSEFRSYYQNKYVAVKDGGEAGVKHYPYCKECEKIENRRRYLIKIEHTDSDEYEMINKLYDKRIALGLDVPRSYLSDAPALEISNLVTKQLEALKAREVQNGSEN